MLRKQSAHAIDASKRVRSDFLQQRFAVSLAQEMIGMGDDAVLRMETAGVIGTGLDIDDFAAARAEQEIRRAGARRLERHKHRLVQRLRIEHLAAAHVERLAIGMTPVSARSEPVLDEADAAFVDAHLAAGDPGFRETDEARLVRAFHLQHETARVQSLEPIAVLAQPGVSVRTDLRQQAEGRAAVGRSQLPPVRRMHGFFAEQRKGKLIAGIEKRNALLALPGALRNPAHLLGIGRIGGCNGAKPTLGLHKSAGAIEAGRCKSAQIGLDVVGDLACEAVPMGKAAFMRAAFDRKKWDGTHAVTQYAFDIVLEQHAAGWAKSLKHRRPRGWGRGLGAASPRIYVSFQGISTVNGLPAGAALGRE